MTENETDFSMMRRVVALTIAGSDSGGNAGIQADLRAFHVFGVHGCTVLAALTAQNPFGVRGILTADAEFVGMQLDAVLEAYAVSALKTGMLSSPDVIEAVADRLVPHNRISKVMDPVMVATSGARLLQDDAVATLTGKLLPLATLITPNLPEAEVLAGHAVGGRDAIAEAARELGDTFGTAVLIKGGHVESVEAEDVLYDGECVHRIAAPRIEQPLSTHGTGCSLSAAIAASLACGKALLDAVVEGKAYVYESIRTAIRVGEAAAVLGTPVRLPVERVRVDTLRNT
ncbi:MAG TPA: bifunctional hydroxymethylpyrimidine kinase/phosphomethylpyrimidine kinase [Kiritimatiellia bacterium]|nr:bifunctional hydroxymethylpyrimidine kinase/phosphomethylpyrimidine kinase [Kiritimatiellia bacterium]HRU71355.1 bifunctional hydroxymethylpyrimidine kinase/phosphomethylpyrimidine kinase [Kiritimatiellia bacterium]